MLRHKSEDPRPAARQRIERHHHADAGEHRGGIGRRVACNARADAIDQRVGADRHRRQQCKEDGAPIRWARSRRPRSESSNTPAASTAMPAQPKGPRRSWSSTAAAVAVINGAEPRASG